MNDQELTAIIGQGLTQDQLYCLMWPAIHALTRVELACDFALQSGRCDREVARRVLLDKKRATAALEALGAIPHDAKEAAQ